MKSSKVELTAADLEELAELLKLSQKVNKADENYVTTISAEFISVC